MRSALRLELCQSGLTGSMVQFLLCTANGHQTKFQNTDLVEKGLFTLMMTPDIQLCEVFMGIFLFNKNHNGCFFFFKYLQPIFHVYLMMYFLGRSGKGRMEAVLRVGGWKWMWPVNWGRWSSSSTLPWWSHIWSTVYSSGLPGSRKAGIS